MGTNVTLFAGKNLPAHVGSFLDEETNIQERQSVPALGIKGKVWTISINGNPQVITKKDEDGDRVPLQTLPVIILDYAKSRGRAYYEGTYNPDATTAPACWSDDGVAPHKTVKEPFASKCDGCEFAKKGSKISEQGKAVAACSQYRLLVVVPAAKPDMQPLRLKLPVTSDWDKEAGNQNGWMAFNQYTDFLRSNGVTHTATLVTKMRFVADVAYPKVVFSAADWVPKDVLDSLKPVIKSDEVKSLLTGDWSPAGVDGVSTKEDAPEAPPVKKAAKAPQPAEDGDDEVDEAPAPKKAAKAPPVEDDDEDADFGISEAPAKSEPPKRRGRPAKAEAPAAAPKKAAKPADDDDEADFGIGDDPAPKKAAKAEAKPAAEKAAVPESVASLLDDWDDE